MKRAVRFPIIILVACVQLLAIVGCQDPMDEMVVPSEGKGSARPVKVIGNGSETFFVNRHVFFDSDTIYLLDGFIRFRQNAILTIEPGTIIKGLDGKMPGHVPGTLIIERTARINANGTAQNPIIFTSAKLPGARGPGDWGGIIICGRSYVNIRSGINSSDKNYEGFVGGVPSGFLPIRYGSINSIPTINYNDSNGSLTYVRIEFAGSQATGREEAAALSLCGVGAGTTLHHLQISFSGDDGVAWLGGTVDQKYVINYRNSDDDFDSDQGYFGRTQFAFILRDPLLSSTGGGGSRAIESKGDVALAANANQATLSDPVYSNLTIIGPKGYVKTHPGVPADPPDCFEDWWPNVTYNDGVAVLSNSKLDIHNSVVVGFPRLAISCQGVSDVNAMSGIQSVQISRNRFVYDRTVNGDNSATNFPDGRAQVYNELRAVQDCGHPSLDFASKAGLKRSAWNLPATPFEPVPDFTIASTSPLAGNTRPERASFTSTRFVNFQGNPYKGVQDNNIFWDKSIAFRGASDVTGSGWELHSGWTEWTPQSSSYD